MLARAVPRLGRMHRKHATFIAAALALVLGACSEETREDTQEAAGSAAEDIRENAEEAGERIEEGLDDVGDRIEQDEPPARD